MNTRGADLLQVARDLGLRPIALSPFNSADPDSNDGELFQADPNFPVQSCDAKGPYERLCFCVKKPKNCCTKKQQRKCKRNR